MGRVGAISGEVLQAPAIYWPLEEQCFVPVQETATEAAFRPNDDTVVLLFDNSGSIANTPW